jgi:NAD(P)-dependent dehydrogenase (short-subunit alcohol dehydrogenase family)
VGRLERKVAVITGAASGIGAATARKMAAEGAAIVLADIDLTGAEAVAGEINTPGATAVAVEADVADESAVRGMIETAVTTFGGIDVLHNNAAAVGSDVFRRDAAIAELDVEVWNCTMGVNLRGVMFGCKFAIPRMLERGGGVIINTSSVAGLLGELMRPAYGASKAAVIGFTRNVATQYGKQGSTALRSRLVSCRHRPRGTMFRPRRWRCTSGIR